LEIILKIDRKLWSKNNILAKNPNFGQQKKFLVKKQNFWSKNKILVKKRDIGLNPIFG